MSLYAQNVQWASSVLKYTSQFGKKQYAAKQVLGTPNKVPGFGSSPCAWAAKVDGEKDKVQVGGEERIKVGFKKYIRIQQVAIAENYNPGAVEKVYL